MLSSNKIYKPAIRAHYNPRRSIHQPCYLITRFKILTMWYNTLWVCMGLGPSLAFGSLARSSKMSVNIYQSTLPTRLGFWKWVFDTVHKSITLSVIDCAVRNLQHWLCLLAVGTHALPTAAANHFCVQLLRITILWLFNNHSNTRSAITSLTVYNGGWTTGFLSHAVTG
jgi:hypothetical protein